MKQKRKYSEARMEVVQLSGKSQLLSGSTSVGTPIDGTLGAGRLWLGNFTRDYDTNPFQ